MGRYKKINLSKGATLYYVKNNISDITKVEVGFDCGGQVDGKNYGLSHFVEHCLFTGTKELDKKKMAKKYFDFINVNAFTSYRNIYFTGKIFNNELGDYLDTVRTMITESTFNQEVLDEEKKVVIQEITRKKDKYDIFANSLFWNTAYNWDLTKYGMLGSEECVNSITSQDVKDYVNRYFITNNLHIYVCSPLSKSKVKRLVENKLVKRLPHRDTTENIPIIDEALVRDDFYINEKVDIDKIYIHLGIKLNKSMYDHEFKVKFGLILDMMNDYSEGLMKTLRLEKNLTYSAGFGRDYNKTNGLLSFSTNVSKENVKECVNTVADYLKNIRDNGFTEAQLKKAKRLYEHGSASKEPRTERLIDKLSQYRYYGKVLKTKPYKKIRKNFTIEEANAMAKEVFSNMKVCASFYGNADKKDLYTKAQFKKLFK